MRLFAVIAVLAVTFGVRADEDCLPTQDGNAKDVHDVLVKTVNECFLKVGDINIEFLKELSADDGPRHDFGDYCKRYDLIKNCLSTISTNSSSSACPNETQHRALVFLEHALKTALSYSCLNNGEHISFVTFGVFRTNDSTAERNAFTECFDTAKATGAEGNTLGTTNSLLGLYRETKVFKQCLVSRLREVNEVVYGVEVILNGVLRSMKCPRPDEDGSTTTTLCETLDDAAPSTDERVCPYKSGDEGQPPRLAIFVSFATECGLVNVNNLDFDVLMNATSIEDYQSFFRTYCENRQRILDCVGDVSSNSKICQNSTNHQILKTMVDFLEHTLGTGCKNDGAVLATILSGLVNRKEQAVGSDTMEDCKQAAKVMSMSDSDADQNIPSKRVLLAYRIMVSFKQCILDGATDVGSFKSVFTTFMNELQSAAKCVNPDDETIVNCDILINH